MRGINLARVMASGLLAGLVFNAGEWLLNAVVLAAPMQDMLKRHNLTDPGGRGIAIFIVMGFVFGVVLEWLYAAVRPRLGPGPKTAACVAVSVWFPAYLFPTVGWYLFGALPVNLAALGAGWGLVEMILATVIGAWVYKEG